MRHEIWNKTNWNAFELLSDAEMSSCVWFVCRWSWTCFSTSNCWTIVRCIIFWVAAVFYHPFIQFQVNKLRSYPRHRQRCKSGGFTSRSLCVLLLKNMSLSAYFKHTGNTNKRLVILRLLPNIFALSTVFISASKHILYWSINIWRTIFERSSQLVYYMLSTAMIVRNFTMQWRKLILYDSQSNAFIFLFLIYSFNFPLSLR